MSVAVRRAACSGRVPTLAAAPATIVVFRKSRRFNGLIGTSVFGELRAQPLAEMVARPNADRRTL